MDKRDEALTAQVGDIYTLENRHFLKENSLVPRIVERVGHFYSDRENRRRLHMYWMGETESEVDDG